MRNRIIPVLVLASSMLFSCGTAQASGETVVNSADLETSLAEEVVSQANKNNTIDGNMLELDAEISSHTSNNSIKNKNIKRAADTTFKIEAATLNVLSNIDLVFIVANTPAAATESGVLCWKTPKTDFSEYTVGSENVLPTFSYDEAYGDGNTEHDGYFCLGNGNMAPYMMTDVVYARAYYSDGTDYHYSDVVKYSVLDYCYNKKDSTSVLGDTTLGAYTKDILAYGAASQSAHSYKTNRLANVTYYKVSTNKTFGWLSDGFKSGLYNKEESVSMDGNGWSDGTSQFTTNSISVADLVTDGSFTLTKTATGGADVDDNGVLTYTGSDTCVYLPDTVKTINMSSFMTDTGMSLITSLYIPSSVELMSVDTSARRSTGSVDVEVNALTSCIYLTKIVVDPDNARYTSGNNANCVIEKETGKLIAGCKNTVIPTDGSVTSIISGVFPMCAIESITIPASVTSIAYIAFMYCSSLSKITYTGTLSEWNTLVDSMSGGFGFVDMTGTQTSTVYCVEDGETTTLQWRTE